ncbi:hypothetical protein OGAPHI_003935 [Ogataea philodendri]|uniref:cAMP-dependent protein kinase regulatory subunit n=1 Tax=Ogataea philodendri TaxID=1378263 RepID=A0A9P8P5S1_9ASCO|nr:uncharacterized protein OGAPHI_003935 [Ogataea philodendri]KAH3665747.1 hypothetical protein OGAPHI_003935 [Ogataea philodendri]
MSNFQEYTYELAELDRQFKTQNPTDVLQFCYNYFGNRLQQQRQYLWSQKQKAASQGLVLFPSADESAQEAQRKSIPQFKYTLSDNDPHTKHQALDSEDPQAKSTTEPAAGLFRTSFESSPFNTSAPTSKASLGPTDSVETAKPTSRSGFAASAAKTTMRINANRRTSVSAEALNPDTFGEDGWKPPVHQFTSEQLQRLNASVIKNFLFSQLDQESLKTIIFALEEKHVPQGFEIIKQGDEGDFFYVVERGSVDFYVNGQKVNSSGPGSSFGELALMYNSPRAATAIAQSECILWALDRMTFRRILLEGTSKKRTMYENFLKEIPVLKSLSSYERSKLADALNTETYTVGQNVVTEGEAGENFYFIEDGTADVIKQGQGVVTKLNKGDYFGELALLYDSPRQATVKASSTLKVVTLDKSGFQRLLGPAVEVLKLQDPTKH